jgi:hypothetical protein
MKVQSLGDANIHNSLRAKGVENGDAVPFLDFRFRGFGDVKDSYTLH